MNQNNLVSVFYVPTAGRHPQNPLMPDDTGVGRLEATFAKAEEILSAGGRVLLVYTGGYETNEGITLAHGLLAYTNAHNQVMMPYVRVLDGRGNRTRRDVCLAWFGVKHQLRKDPMFADCILHEVWFTSNRGHFDRTEPEIRRLVENKVPVRFLDSHEAVGKVSRVIDPILGVLERIPFGPLLVDRVANHRAKSSARHTEEFLKTAPYRDGLLDPILQAERVLDGSGGFVAPILRVS